MLSAAGRSGSAFIRGAGMAGQGRAVKGRLLLLSAGGLGLVDTAGRHHWVRPDGEAEHTSRPGSQRPRPAETSGNGSPLPDTSPEGLAQPPG